MTDEMDTEFLKVSDYIKHFNIHFALLLKRYKRFKEIDDIHNTDIDVVTYLDMIIVQLRAICIESERNKKNYTAQVLLRKVGEGALADKIDAMLKEDFYDGSLKLDIRTALKILADEFICHYDNFDDDDHRLMLSEIFMNDLRNPYKIKNLDYIMRTLINCIGEGLTLKLNKNSKSEEQQWGSVK